MAGRRKTPEEVAWLEAHVPRLTAPEVVCAFRERFGWAPGVPALQVWASKRHLRFGRHSERAIERATHAVRWSQEPEMEAWMLEHDRGQSTRAISEAFEERFGFPLSRPQISLFRSSHGTQIRRSHGGGRPKRPVGFERVGKDGYILVKVREEPTVAQSKDNWRFKHWIAWEEANGREVPPDHVIYFVNGDIRDFRPENLICVHRRYMTSLGNMRPSGGWPDRETLLAAIQLADLETAIVDVKNRPRPCAICGATFTPDPHNRYSQQNACRACLDAGHKAPRHTTEPAVCEKCGKAYDRWMRRQRFCPECSTSHNRKGRQTWKSYCMSACGNAPMMGESSTRMERRW